ncbi:MAG: CHAP domain-containing protein [Alphaproteobacteria bacterium]|nr:CHAP domain-containing protein [Alphaproteobacteria bacterium]
MTALAACVNTPHYASRQPAPVPVQTGMRAPDIAPASTALAHVASALDVSVRTINSTPRPGAGILASADVQPRVAYISRRLQCVPFARERSGVAIRGNANTWWKQAAGQFVRVKAPAVGSVIVMQTRRGHVGVVTKVVDSRTIVIDHSNWFSNGQIYLDQPVMDVSANNDWSKVVVWNGPRASYGKRALGVSGFIVPASARGNSTVYASLADVPATLAGNVQYAEAVVRTPAKAAPAAVPVKAAPVLVAATEAPVAKPVAKPAAAPVLVAEADIDALPARKPIYVNTIIPASKPASLRAPAAVASAEAQPAATVALASATPVYVDTIVPASKPGSIAGSASVAPMAVAEAAPVLVDTIVPKSKPASLGASTAIASAEATKAPTYVDVIVPQAKPSSLGATEVALIRKGDTSIEGNTDGTFVPSEKPTSVTTFR